jgi:hypothetical protein
VAEQPVFWLGGAPGKSREKDQEKLAAERYESALRDACTACGYDVDEYVAAQGGFGGWLAHLNRDGKPYRVFWSGKTKRLSLEEAHAGGGWNELAGIDVADEDVASFVTALKDVFHKQGQTSG